MTLTKEIEEKINSWEVDPNPSSDDKFKMDQLGIICAWQGIMYVNMRKFIAPENEGIDNEVYIKLDNDVYLIIDFVTKGGDITEDMIKTATDFINTIDPNDSRLNSTDAASYVFNAVRKVDDPLTLENLKMSAAKYAFNAPNANVDTYWDSMSIIDTLNLIQLDHDRGLYY